MKFKINLHSTWWNVPPTVKILVDNCEYFFNQITDPCVIEFDHTSNQERTELKIILSNKDNLQTVVENGIIIKDQLLHIDNIEIENIELGELVYQGIYQPEYPSQWAQENIDAGTPLPQFLKNIDVLGFNGAWTFSFTSPFHIWYLENLS